MSRASSRTGRASLRARTASSQMRRASLGVRTAPSRSLIVARGAATGARRSSGAPRRARSGALDVWGASVVNCDSVPWHSSGVATNTSGCPPRSDGNCRGSAGSLRCAERSPRHAQGCSRSSGSSFRSSQRRRPPLCRRSTSSASVPPRGDGCSIHSDGCPTHSERPLCQRRRRLQELAAMLSKKHGQLSPKNGMPSANHAMPCSNFGMLQPFAGALCEREDAIREESRDHRVLVVVPAPWPRERLGRRELPSQGAATLCTKLGTPSMGLATPNERRTMPKAKARSPRRHPPSLQRFVLEESTCRGRLWSSVPGRLFFLRVASMRLRKQHEHHRHEK
jgi:hypothetical protein